MENEASIHEELEEKSIGRKRSQHDITACSVNNLDAEKVLNAFGKYGKYQMISHFLLSIVHTFHASQVLIMSFIAVPPEFECYIDEAERMSMKDYTVMDRCNIVDENNRTIACADVPGARFRYNESVRYSTLNSEFDLVCRDEHWAQHASSVFMLGLCISCYYIVSEWLYLKSLTIYLETPHQFIRGMIATPFLTQLSDLYGRRYTFLIPLWLSVAANVGCAAAPTYGLFLFFRLLCGIGATGYGTIGWILCCESVAVEFRSLIPFVGTFTWVFGIVLVGVLRMCITNWRLLFLACATPGLLTIGYYWWIPESLHWMITHGKHTKIRRYIKRSTQINRIELCLADCKATNAEIEKAKKRTVLDILRHKQLLFHITVHCVLTIVMNMSYWGLALLSTQLSEDGYTGYFLSGFVEIPGGLIAVALLIKFGRRTITFWSLFLQGVSMGFAILYPGPGKIEMIFPIAAKLFNCIAWCAQPLLLAEMTPTSIRNVFYGLVQFFGESGSVLSPYLGLLSEIHPVAPQTTVAVLSVLIAVLTLTSPETKDKPMPEDLDQFDPGCLFKRQNQKNIEKRLVEDGVQNAAELDVMLPTSAEADNSTTAESTEKSLEPS